MKIRFRLLSVLLIIVLFIQNVQAESSGSCYFKGPDETEQNRFVFVEVWANGDRLSDISGTITYDSEALIYFESIENISLSAWNIKVSNADRSEISFTASSSVNTISADTLLFTLKFIVRDSFTGNIEVSFSSLTSNEVIKKTVITNQDAIDAARNDPSITEIPDPVYEEVSETVTTDLEKNPYSLNISKLVSDNCYLKSVTSPDAAISPEFSKLVNNYKLITKKKDGNIQLHAVPESNDSIVEISEELNNQIIITVTSESGTVNSYVFNIDRNSSYPDNNNHNSSIITPSGIDPLTKGLLLALAGVSFAIMLLGGYYVYSGTKES